MYQASPKRQRRGRTAAKEQLSTYAPAATPSTPPPVEPLDDTVKEKRIITQRVKRHT